MKLLFHMMVLGVVLTMTTVADDVPKHSYIPKDGFVPDEATAIQIAEAIFTPIYGKDAVKKERPFKATLNKNVWTVVGSIPKGMEGGVAIAEIAKKDSKIIRVSHGK
jgi:hypothetical protein